MAIGIGLEISRVWDKHDNNPMFSLKSTNSINATIAAMHRATKEANAKIASQVTETAQANAPVESGALRDSIVATEGGVIVGADYGLFVEIGTDTAPAAPFLTPALQDHADDYAAALKEALN